jgi:hypothetical protein
LQDARTDTVSDLSDELRVGYRVFIETALQLALNLLQFGDIAGSGYDTAAQDHEQHVDESVSRDVYEFSEHLVPASQLKNGYVGWVDATEPPEQGACHH